MAAQRLVKADWVGDKASKLINWLIGGTPTVAGEIGYETAGTAGDRILHQTTTGTEQVAHLSDITKAEDFQKLLTTVALPVVGDLTNGAAGIVKGDYWIYNATGDLPAPTLLGDDTIEPGDKIVALVDGASAAGDFAIFQTNVDLTGLLVKEIVTVNLVAGTPLVVPLSVTPTEIVQVSTYLGNIRTEVGETTDDTTITLESNTAITGLEVRVTYDA